MLSAMNYLSYLLLVLFVACGPDDHRKTPWCTEFYCVTPGKVPILPRAVELMVAKTIGEFQHVESGRGKVFTTVEIAESLRKLPLKIRFVEDMIHEEFCSEGGCLGYTIGRDDIRVVMRNSYEADRMVQSSLAHEILHALLWRFDLQANLNPDQVGLEVSPRGLTKHAAIFFYEPGAAEFVARDAALNILCPI